MFTSISRRSQTASISNYTLDSDLFSSIDRLILYSLRKFPSFQAIFRKNIGKWPDSLGKKIIDFKIEAVPEDRNRLTYLGHRTVFIQMEGIRLLTDPVLSKRLISGGLGVKRVGRNWYKYWNFPPADFLLLSNNSFDCMDEWTLRKIADQGGAIAVGGRNLTKYLNQFYNRYTYPLSWFEEVDFGSLKITFMPAMSETKRKFMCCGIDRNKLLWGGFLLKSDNTTVFYAGKTCYSDHFKEIKDHLDQKKCNIDIAILPIGPIFREKRNMTPEEAVSAHLTLNPKKTLVVAHDTFPLGIEAFGELKSRLLSEIKRVDPSISDQFVVLDEAQSFDFEPSF